MKSNRKNVMEESLKVAAEIRRKLEGRHHSDSTRVVAEDRGSSTERDYTSADLLSEVTNKNRHEEIDCGAPAGKEKW